MLELELLVIAQALTGIKNIYSMCNDKCEDCDLRDYETCPNCNGTGKIELAEHYAVKG